MARSTSDVSKSQRCAIIFFADSLSQLAIQMSVIQCHQNLHSYGKKCSMAFGLESSRALDSSFSPSRLEVGKSVTLDEG